MPPLSPLLLLLLVASSSVGDAGAKRLARPAGGARGSGPPLSSEHRFGFVVGVHFSGTSILHYALGRHPDVSIMRVSPKRMDEGQFFQDVMPNGA